MSSTTETGHAKNVATFGELVSFCKGFGASYNPSNDALKLTELNLKLAAAQAALETVRTTKTTYDNATNAREKVMTPLRPLSTKIINALAASGANRLTIDDARTVINKIHPRGRKPKLVADGEETPRTISTSQQSNNSLINHFAHLIEILKAETTYAPNEFELKVTTLTTLIEEMETKNTTVSTAWTNLSNARITRDKLLYGELTGVIDIALDVKTYIKSVFGPRSPEFNQVGGLRFARTSGN